MKISKRKLYYLQNRDSLLQRQKEYFYEKRSERTNYQRLYEVLNKEKIRIKKIKFYKKHRGKILFRMRFMKWLQKIAES